MTANLKIRDLELVVALHEEGNVTQAAKRVGISEPALSKRLRLVERKVAARLFERSHNGAKATDSGRNFVAHAVDSLHAFRLAIHEAQEAKHGEQSKLRIGVSSYLPPSLIETLQSIELPLYRDLTIQVVAGLSTELLTGLQQRRVDLAVVTSPPQTPTITTLCISTSPFMIVFRQGHRLASKKSVSLVEVAEYPWVFFNRNIHPLLHDLILRRTEDTNRKPNIVHHVSQAEQVGALLTNDTMIAWLNPSGVEHLANRGFVHVPLSDNEIRLETHLATLAGNTSRMVSEFVRKFVKRLGSHRQPEQLRLPIM
jgi:DNA-binding transcriptional LysR family regulator